MTQKIFAIKNFFYLSYSIKLHFFKTLILPHYDYCSSLFLNFSNTLLENIKGLYSKNNDFAPLPLPSRYRYTVTVIDRDRPLLDVTQRYWTLPAIKSVTSVSERYQHYLALRTRFFWKEIYTRWLEIKKLNLFTNNLFQILINTNDLNKI